MQHAFYAIVAERKMFYGNASDQWWENYQFLIALIG